MVGDSPCWRSRLELWLDRTDPGIRHKKHDSPYYRYCHHGIWSPASYKGVLQEKNIITVLLSQKSTAYMPI